MHPYHSQHWRMIEKPHPKRAVGFISLKSCLQRWLVDFGPRKSEMSTKSSELPVVSGIVGLLKSCCSWEARAAPQTCSVFLDKGFCWIASSSSLWDSGERKLLSIHTESSFLIYTKASFISLSFICFQVIVLMLIAILQSFLAHCIINISLVNIAALL